MSEHERRSEKQARKRREAEARNALTPHAKTKAHRMKRCNCETPEGRLLTAVFGEKA